MFSQAELARQAGVSIRTVRNIESGVVVPQGTTLRRLLNVLPHDELGRPSAPPLPARQLPALPRVVVGRDVELVRITSVLGDRPDPTSLLVLLVGGAGVGKSTLAGHLLRRRRVSERSDVDELYADLRGSTDHPAAPAAVLGGFLRALGVAPESVPELLEERVTLFRTHCASRSPVMLLDDAADESQVRPLLPGTGECVTVVTSRNRLAGLAPDLRCDVAPLDDDAAMQLLHLASGRAFAHADQPEITAILRSCAGLPLAVHIAGTRLAPGSGMSTEDLAGALADESRRLDALAVGDLEVRAGLRATYGAMTAADQAVFRALAAVQTPSFPSWVAAAAAASPPQCGGQFVARLTAVNVLDEASSGRYRMHALTALFGRELAEVQDLPARRDGSIQRIVGGWLQLSRVARDRFGQGYRAPPSDLTPTWTLGDVDCDRMVGEPLAWFEATSPSLDWIVRSAGVVDPTLSWQLVEAWVPFLQCRNAWVEQRSIIELALRAAQARRVHVAECNLERLLGNWHAGRGDLRGAEDRYRRAMDLSEILGDNLCAANAGQGMAYVARVRGDVESALREIEDALVLADVAEDPWVLAVCGYERGRIQLDRGRFGAASHDLVRARTLFVQIGDRRCTALADARLGEVALAEGAAERALPLLEGAWRILHEVNDLQATAMVSCTLGEAFLALGRRAQAEVAVIRAVQVATAAGDQACRVRASRLWRRLGQSAGGTAVLPRSCRTVAVESSGHRVDH